MTLNEFLPLVGTRMVADCTPDEVEITLVEALPSRHGGFNDRPSFLLIFRSEPEAMLTDGIYTVRGRNFGPDNIAITSLIRPRDAAAGHYYQAVFN